MSTLPIPDDRLRDDLAITVFTQAMNGCTGLGDISDTERQALLESIACVSYDAAQAFINVRQALARGRR